MDGACGTMLRSRGLTDPDCLLAVSHPEIITGLHSQYAAAGADILRTATFNVSTLALSHPSPEEFIRTTIQAACQAARKGAKQSGRRIFISGCIGPAKTTRADYFAMQREAFECEGVDLLCIETAYEPVGTRVALEGCSNFSELPVMLSVTPVGATPEEQRRQIAELMAIGEEYRVLILGLNCGSDPRVLAEMTSLIPDSVVPAFCPSCGLPDAEGRYHLTPKEFVSIIEPLIAAGRINIAGGCCGTTPEHIRLLSPAAHGARSGESKTFISQ